MLKSAAKQWQARLLSNILVLDRFENKFILCLGSFSLLPEVLDEQALFVMFLNERVPMYEETRNVMHSQYEHAALYADGEPARR